MTRIFSLTKLSKKSIAISLIEVMVAAAILAIALLGIISMQSRLLNMTIESSRQESAYRMISQMNNLILIASNNVSEALNSLLSTSITAPDNCYITNAGRSTSDSFCTISQFYRHKFQEWNHNLSQILPSGVGSICTVVDSSKNLVGAGLNPPSVTFRVTVSWNNLFGNISSVALEQVVVITRPNDVTIGNCN